MAVVETITLTDVAVPLRLGVTAAERARPQTVLVTVALTLTRPPEHDDLAETVDYDRITGFLQRELPAAGEVHLVETVADHIATHALSLSARAARVTVTVKKPSVLAAPAMVSVTLTRDAAP